MWRTLLIAVISTSVLCYAQNDSGSCECGPNSSPGCGINCGRHCSNLNDTPPADGNYVCQALCKDDGCDCVDGYYFDDNTDSCVLPKDCTPTCSVNEEYSTCANGQCYPRTCATMDDGKACPKVAKCVGGCICLDGYLRADNGTCIPKNQCRKPCPINEIFDLCPSSCPPRNCNTSDAQFKCPAPLQVGDPKCPRPKCRCKDNYYRNEIGTCVTKKQCKQCPVNEVYDLCPATCPPRTCNTSDLRFSCVRQPVPGDKNCQKAKCRCLNNYFRNNDGRCVTRDECHNCYRENEEWNACPSGREQTCEDLNCNQKSQVNTSPRRKTCKGECRCKAGYYRNYLGECISKANCVRCNGPNEFYSCGGACDNVCATLQKQNQTNCPIVNIKCNEMCYCKEGHARNDNNTCVPFDKCEVHNCGVNQTYDPCANGRCSPFKCSEKDGPYYCSSITACEGACVCKEGYLLNYLGECILQEDCKVCGANATAGCGVNCGKHCINLANPPPDGEPVVCNAICRDGCDCNEGYYLDDKTGNCVLPEDCTPQDSSTTTAPSSNNSSSTCSSEDLALSLAKFYKGNEQFTVDFYAETSIDNGDQSTIMSPYSLLFLLAQLLEFSTGDTEKQLLSAMNLDSKDEISCIIPALLDSIQDANTKAVFKLAIKVFANQNYELSDAFKDSTENTFRAKAENVDFSQASQAAQIINDWVANNTDNKIQDIISASALSELTRIVLADALYFKGQWQQPFNINNTQLRDFNKSDNTTVQRQMMYQNSRFPYNYDSDLDCEILLMPYEGNFSMVIFLPSQVDGLAALQQKMRNITLLDKAIDNLVNRTVHVYIPRMTIETSIDLVPLLKKLNITQMFDPSNSGIEGILAKPEDVYVSDARQKSYLDVNEEGTVAVSANVITVTTTSAVLNPLIFDANHGFALLIRYNDAITFVGSYQS